MKAKIPPHHTPLPGKDVPVTNGDDIVECLEKLQINESRQSKTTGITKSETRNERNIALNCKKNIKTEAKTKETQKIATKSHTKSEDVKEKEKSKTKEEKKSEKKEEPLGELCARGPDRKGLATQIRNYPYTIEHAQKNTSLANGGHIICNLPQTQLSPGIYYPPSTCQPRECFTNQCAPFSNDHSYFPNNIPNYTQEVYECPDLLQSTLSPVKPEALSPGKPEGFSPPESEAQCYPQDDSGLEQIIQEVTSDPEFTAKVCKELAELVETENVTSEPRNIPEMWSELSPYSSHGNLSSASSPQTVPCISPYHINNGSPPGPSSPNIPIFSPNIPSPRGGYWSDDSSNNMYQSSTPPMTKQASYSPEINFDDILSRPPEGKRLEEKKLVQELNSTCSRAEVGQQMLNLQNRNVPLTALIVPVTVQPTANTTQGVCRYRAIAPKPSVRDNPRQSVNNIKIQNISTQQVNCNGTACNPRKGVLSVKEQFLARCCPEIRKEMYIKLQRYSDEIISKCDEDGDTQLMIITSNPEEYSHEKFSAVVERCRHLPHVFCKKNKDGYSALFLACTLKNDDPLVAKLIAEAMIDAGINMNEPDKDGSTIIHDLCKVGDKCAKVLDELLSLRDEQGKQCFNINKSDYEGRSPLHVAVKHHAGVSCLQMVKVLLKHGADVESMDGKQGSTPLHFALATDKHDQNLIRILCKAMEEKKDLVNTKNYKGDTPLHVAMAFGDCMEQNTRHCILDSLMISGASRAIRNQNGKVPLELAPDACKVEIKKILDKYSIQ